LGYRSHLIPNSTSRRNRAKRTSGYTLIELMIVVIITGVLAAVAIPAFRGYIQKSRTAEAAAFLGVIKLRQTSYRGEFGQYAGFTASVGTMGFVPADATVMRGGMQLPFPAAPAVLGPIDAASPFFAIGATPDGAVRFGYGMVAGTPLQAGAGGGGTDLASPPYEVPATELDFYFIAQARTDLDSDNDPLIMETSSFMRDIWISDTANGWD
jgi:prepilin-type N-terminal cleavage/methylation domain-containing protein